MYYYKILHIKKKTLNDCSSFYTHVTRIVSAFVKTHEESINYICT